MHKNSLGFQEPLLKSIRKEEKEEEKKKEKREGIHNLLLQAKTALKKELLLISTPKLRQLDCDPQIQRVGKEG